MNYKNIIDTIKTICDNHYFINTFGYGDISDISTPDDNEAPDYPYVFLNPVTFNMGDKTTSFNFNLICMTQAYDTETDIITQQSNCMVYVKDIISKVNMTLDNPLIEFIEPYNITPFKERFSDDVVGATANITIEFANVLDNCFTKISGDTITEVPGPPVRVVDGDETIHYVNPGGSYTCLPATAKSGILYQRVVPWQGFDTSSVVGSVEWHRDQGTYNYTAPINPVSSSLLKNGYFGSDNECLLYFDNAFGNNFRYTNDIGQQYVEDFNRSPENLSPNPQYCIDHLTGLGIYVWEAYDREFFGWDDAIIYSNNLNYGGFTDWRSGDVGEFLAMFDYNDWRVAWPQAYTPWMDSNVRSYGGALWMGCRDTDGFYLYIDTNANTIERTTDPNRLLDHSLIVRNHFIS